MSSYKSNAESREALSREMASLHTLCANTCNIIQNNAPVEMSNISSKNVQEMGLCYIEGLRVNLENSKTPVIDDENIITSQFLSNLKAMNSQLEELTAFTKGSIHDVSSEINRLQAQIKTVQEAKAQRLVKRREIGHKQLQKAKDRFKMMRNELHGLINSLFPQFSEQMTVLIGCLMQESVDENSNGYVAVTTENFKFIELLKDVNIVTENPYNNKEVKLAY